MYEKQYFAFDFFERIGFRLITGNEKVYSIISKVFKDFYCHLF